MCVCKAVRAFGHTHSTLCNHIGNFSHPINLYVDSRFGAWRRTFLCWEDSSKPYPTPAYTVGTLCLTSLIPGLKYIPAHDMVPQPLVNACSCSGTVTPFTVCWKSTEPVGSRHPKVHLCRSEHPPVGPMPTWRAASPASPVASIYRWFCAPQGIHARNVQAPSSW